MKKNYLIFHSILLIIYFLTHSSCYSQGSIRAFSFNGTDSKIIIPDKLNFKFQTIEAWVYINPSKMETRTIIADSSNYILTICFALPDSYYIKYQVRVNDDWYTQLSDTDLKKNQWYHIAATFDGNSLSIYKDGVCVNRYKTTIKKSEKTSKTSEIPPTNTNVIGCFALDSYLTKDHFYGLIDEVRLWSVALKEDQIKFWKNIPVTDRHSNWKNLLCYYKCDDTELKNDSRCIVDTKSQNNGIPHNITYYKYPEPTSKYVKSTFEDETDRFCSMHTAGVFFNNKIHQFYSRGEYTSDGLYEKLANVDNNNNVYFLNSSGYLHGSKSAPDIQIPACCLVYKNNLIMTSYIPNKSVFYYISYPNGKVPGDGIQRNIPLQSKPTMAVLKDTLYFFNIYQGNLNVDWSVDGVNWTFLKTIRTGLDSKWTSISAYKSRDIKGNEVIYIAYVDKVNQGIQLVRFYKDSSVNEYFIYVKNIRNVSIVPGTVEGGFSNGYALQIFYTANTPDKFGCKYTTGRIEYSIENQYPHLAEQLSICNEDFSHDDDNGQFSPYAYEYFQTYGSNGEKLGKKIILSMSRFEKVDYFYVRHFIDFLVWNSDQMTYIPEADTTINNVDPRISHLIGVIEGPPPFVLNGDNLDSLVSSELYPSFLEIGSSESTDSINSVSFDHTWNVSFRYYGLGGDWEHHSENTQKNKFSKKIYTNNLIYPISGRPQGYKIYSRPILTRKKYLLTDANNNFLDNVYTITVTDKYIDFVPYYLDTVPYSPNPNNFSSYINRNLDLNSYDKIFSSNFHWTSGNETTIGLETENSTTHANRIEFYKGFGITIEISMGIDLKPFTMDYNVLNFESRIGSTTINEGSTTIGNTKNMALTLKCPYHGKTNDTSHFIGTVYWIKPTKGKLNWWVPKDFQNDEPWCITYEIEGFTSLPPNPVDETIQNYLEISNINPNPVSDNVSIIYYLNNSSESKMTIYNSIGLIIKQFNHSELTGKNSILFSTKDLPSGKYYCILTDGIKRTAKSFIVLN